LLCACASLRSAQVREQAHDGVISNLINRLEDTESALKKSTAMVDELTAEKITRDRRIAADAKTHQEEGRSWSSDSMAMKLQLNDYESVETQLREELLSTKKLLQQKSAEINSLQNTSSTIQVVKETAEARVRNEVGALLQMQEQRLAAQSAGERASFEEDEYLLAINQHPRNGYRHNIMATSTNKLTLYYSTQFVFVWFAFTRRRTENIVGCQNFSSRG